MKLALSPGHNRYARGAVNHRFRRSEHDLACRMNKLVELHLLDADLSVYSVPLDTLDDKAKQVNSVEADFAVETHFNSSENPRASGFEVLYYPGSEDGKVLAQCLLQSFHEYLPFKIRGVKERADLFFLSATRCPAVIIEPFFISNDQELMYLEHYPRGLEVLSLAVSRGIKAYAIVKKELP